MKYWPPFLAGLLFGIGLVLGGMSQPEKVIGFLDLAGAWDPSLAFVMGGAIPVAFVAFRLAARRSVALNGEKFDLPRSRVIDARLLAGSILFGIGWGMAGLCPGPALLDAGFVAPGALLFVLAMAAGIVVVDRSPSFRPARAATGDV